MTTQTNKKTAKPIQVRVSTEEAARVERLAKIFGVSKSEVLRMYLPSAVDIYGPIEAQVIANREYTKL